MPMTDEFRNLLKNAQRRLDPKVGFEVAINRAFELGIQPYRDRKNKSTYHRKRLDGESEFYLEL
jgi:hypothetical protein